MPDYLNDSQQTYNHRFPYPDLTAKQTSRLDSQLTFDLQPFDMGCGEKLVILGKCFDNHLLI
jgi:hypothetical protein